MFVFLFLCIYTNPAIGCYMNKTILWESTPVTTSEAINIMCSTAYHVDVTQVWKKRRWVQNNEFFGGGRSTLDKSTWSVAKTSSGTSDCDARKLSEEDTSIWHHVSSTQREYRVQWRDKADLRGWLCVSTWHQMRHHRMGPHLCQQYIWYAILFVVLCC